MRIGFVGAGKVGFTLGKYISERNGCVSGYYSRSEESARAASDFTHTRYCETLGELIESSDALFLTVPDGALKSVWNSMKRYSLTGKCICHCSGAMSSAVFSEIDQMGAFGYSIHPLFAVHSRLQSYQEISKAYFTVEGAPEYLDFWKTYLESLGNPVCIIDAEQKVLYHSAAVFASNLVTGLYEAGVRLLVECGFDEKSGQEALAPLFVNNCLNVAKAGPMEALTGPVVVGHGIRTGIKITTSHPASLGSDLVVDAVAASEEHEGPLLIGIGVFLKKSRFLPESFFEQGNKLVFQLLIPCSTFTSIYACPGLSDVNGSFMLYGMFAAFIIFFLGLITTHLFIREPISRSAAHQCTFRSNIPVLGAALATSLAGNDGAVLLATFMMVIIPLLNIFAVITLSAHENTASEKKTPADILRNILKNPLIIACILGFAVLAAREWVHGFTIRENMPYVYEVISKLGASTTPISLLILGGLVDFSAIGGKLKEIIFGVVWKLILAPFLSIGMAAGLSRLGVMTFGIPEYAVHLSTFGSTIAIASAPMTAQMGGDAELARQYVMWTNVFLVIAMPAEIILMRVLGLI